MYEKFWGKIFETSQEDLWKTFFQSKYADFQNFFGNFLGRIQANIQESTNLVLQEECCVIKQNLQKKYAMLTLSLDVICDVMGYLRNAAVKSTISKQRKLTFGQLKKQSGV